MKESGITPDIMTYSWIMSAVWKDNEEVIKYFKELKAAKLKPSIHEYNKVIIFLIIFSTILKIKFIYIVININNE